MAAELLACQGAHNTEELQAGWKTQWRSDAGLKIPKRFMQEWCIIVREMNCVCSEPKLLAGCWLCRVIKMLTGREKLLNFMYTRGVLCTMVCQSLNLQAFFRCPRCYFFVGDYVWCVGSWSIWETGVLGFRWGRVFHPLCWTHGFNHSEITTAWVLSSLWLKCNFNFKSYS